MDFNSSFVDLKKRIEKYEHDRMSKYYRQVAELEDWKLKISDKIEMSHQVTDAISTHFGIENEVVVWNQISDVMVKCLEGRQLNKFIDFINSKQNMITKKKLS